MSTETKRNFKGNDVEMLTAITSIAQAATDNETELAAKRAVWAPPFFTNLQTEINLVRQNYIGGDNVKDLRKATQLVTSIQTDALNMLEEVKVQIERDFRKDATTRDELLKELGYADYFKAARQKDQSALVYLLFRFKQALSPDVQASLTAKGIDATSLTAITGFADDLNNANITQETLKGNRKGSTQTAVTALNNIYDKVIDVAVIAAKFYKNNKALQDRFIYTKVLNAQKGGVKSSTKSPEQKPAVVTPAS